jgi:hypothetical protein
MKAVLLCEKCGYLYGEATNLNEGIGDVTTIWNKWAHKPCPQCPPGFGPLTTDDIVVALYEIADGGKDVPDTVLDMAKFIVDLLHWSDSRGDPKYWVTGTEHEYREKLLKMAREVLTRDT